MEHEHTTEGIQQCSNQQTIDQNEFPMIVWLRGDEDYAADFSIDADTTMKLIGIRRSRLTQISGKELRVGRMRVGRYIRPVYRQVDIDAYIQWTRPTATHAKSSSMVQDAANKLFEQSQKLESTLSAYLTESLQEMIETTNLKFADILRVQNENLQLLLQDQKVSLQNLSDQFSHSTQRIMNLESQLSDMQSNMNQQWEQVQTQLAVQQSLSSEVENKLKAVEIFMNDGHKGQAELELKLDQAMKQQSQQVLENHGKIVEILEVLLTSQKNILASSEKTVASIRGDLNKSNEFIYQNLLTLTKNKGGASSKA